jgi:hypothetical protein
MKKEVAEKKALGLGHQTISQKLDALDAERAILRLKFGNAILQAAIDLLPETIGQPTESQKPAGSPVLPRIITRLATHPTQTRRPRKESPPTRSENGPLRQILAGEPAE